RGVLTLFAARRGFKPFNRSRCSKYGQRRRARPEQPPGSGTSRLVLGPSILALQPKRSRCRRARRRVASNPAQGSPSRARRDRARARDEGGTPLSVRMKRKDKGRLVDIEMMLTPNLTEPETDLASRAREHTGACINVLLEIVLSSKAP